MIQTPAPPATNAVPNQGRWPLTIAPDDLHFFASVCVQQVRRTVLDITVFLCAIRGYRRDLNALERLERFLDHDLFVFESTVNPQCFDFRFGRGRVAFQERVNFLANRNARLRAPLGASKCTCGIGFLKRAL